MATLELETYSGHIGVERNTPAWRLYRFFDGPTKVYSVFIEGGVATTFPGRAGYTMADVNAADVGSGYNGRAAFIGGFIWDEITAGEQTILEAAGYTVT